LVVLTKLARTKALSPSKLLTGIQCPLRYLVETELADWPSLPDSVPMVVGRCVHKAIEAVLNHRASDIDALIRLTTAAISDELSRHAGAKVLLDVMGISTDAAPGMIMSSAELLERTRVAVRVLQAQPSDSGAAFKPAAPLRRSNDRAASDRRAEATVSSARLDVAGRADLVERADGQTIRITEFKTGNCFDATGHVFSSMIAQVGTYGLIYREVYQASKIGLRIVARDGEWNSDLTGPIIQSAMAAIENLKCRLPRNSDLAAEEISQPGECCLSCKVRPSCSAYRKWAAVQWIQGEHAVPLDTWGTVQSIEVGSRNLCNVRIEDAAGRRVRLTNVPSASVEHMNVATQLEAFDLRSSEGGRGSAHPHNFHVIDLHKFAHSAFSARIQAIG
jgi:hypothetical protein